MNEEVTKNIDLQKIATEGEAIYQTRKGEYEPAYIGEFLAIDIESADVFRSTSSADAVVQARNAHPDKVFYVKKIGFDAAETLASLIRSH